MRHDPASAAIVIMLRSLKMHGMSQAVTDLIEQGAPAFEAAVCGFRKNRTAISLSRGQPFQ
jgi:hypothetical protein